MKNEEEELDFSDDFNDGCERCNCCSTMWEDCGTCGGEGGQDGEELMQEDPFWYGPDDWRECDICEGKGGWYICIGGCNSEGVHQSHSKTA